MSGSSKCWVGDKMYLVDDEVMEYIEQLQAELENSFCTGFSYGTRYGDEGILHGKMTDTELGSHLILAKILYEELQKA